MNADACGWRERLGPFLMGHVSEAERAAVAAHLEGCATCRRERDLLAPVARALEAADPRHVLAETEEPPADLEPRVVRRIRDARAGRRRRVALAGAAAGVVVAVGAWLVIPNIVGSTVDEVTLTSSVPTAAGSASLFERPWGTEVHLRATGLSAGTVYVVWLESVDGERVQGGTFRAPGADEVRMTVAIALDRDESVLLGVTAKDGATVLRGRLEGDR